MTNIAWKNLVRERTRLFISVGGVAFAVVLILVLRGLYSGITDQATEYIRSVRSDLWVSQAGTPGDFFHSVSLIPEGAGERLEGVSGVDRAVPLVGRPIVFRIGDTDVDFFLLGLDPAAGIGGPPEIEEGTAIPGPGEIVVDRVFAGNHGLEVGDILDVRGVRFEIVGVARGGNAIVAQFAWATPQDVVALLDAEGIVNYFLIEAGADPEVVADRISDDMPALQALTADEFADRNIADLREGFLPIVWVLVLIAFAIGIAMIGLTIYTATIEKSREYGLLKAIGFSNRKLHAIVYQQSLIAGVFGFASGTVLSFVLAAAVEALIPQFVTTIGVGDVALAGGAAVIMAVVASFVPLRPIAKLDPAEVFRA